MVELPLSPLALPDEEWGEERPTGPKSSRVPGPAAAPRPRGGTPRESRRSARGPARTSPSSGARPPRPSPELPPPGFRLPGSDARGGGTEVSKEQLMRLQSRVSEVLQQSMRIASCRLKTTQAQQESAVKRRGAELWKEVRFGWPHAVLAPLLWLPFSMVPEKSNRVVVPMLEDSAGERHRSRGLVTIKVRTGRGQLSARSEEWQRQHSTGTEADPVWSRQLEVSDPCELRQIFHVALTEAKLAQAQAVAALRDVRHLQASADGSPMAGAAVVVHRGGNGRGPRGAAAAPAAAAAAAATLEALRRQREKLAKREALLASHLQDLERQNARLAQELQRRGGAVPDLPPAAGASPGPRTLRALPEIATPRSPRPPGDAPSSRPQRGEATPAGPALPSLA